MSELGVEGEILGERERDRETDYYVHIHIIIILVERLIGRYGDSDGDRDIHRQIDG